MPPVSTLLRSRRRPAALPRRSASAGLWPSVLVVAGVLLLAGLPAKGQPAEPSPGDGSVGRQAQASAAQTRPLLRPLRADERASQRVVTPGGRLSTASVASGVGMPVYTNVLGRWIMRSPGTGGARIADDIVTTATPGCPLDRYVVQVSGDADGLGTDLATPFDVTLELFESCPGASGTPTPIPGTRAIVSLPDGELHDVTVAIPADRNVPLPGSFYLGVTFSRANAGVVVGGLPTLGFSADRFDFPGFACGAGFGGFPAAPHASFQAEVFVRDGCPAAHSAYRAENPSGVFFTEGRSGPGGENLFGDDLTLSHFDCDMVAYEVAVRGGCPTCSGAIEFDLRSRLENADPESAGLIPRTRRQVYVFGDDVQVARFSFDPPVSLPEYLFMTFRTSSELVGPIATDRPAQLGDSDSRYLRYAGAAPNGQWEFAPFADPDLYAAFDLTIYCASGPPVGACCDMIQTDEAGESVCRDVPRHNCAPTIDDERSALWVENRPCEDTCVGGTRDEMPCTRQADCPEGECPGPFPFAPCGLGACCVSDGRCYTVTENECEAFGSGGDTSLFQRGQICGLPGQRCPVSPCAWAQGSCFEPREGRCLIGPTTGEVCDPSFSVECVGECFPRAEGEAPTPCTNDRQCTSGICAHQACDGGGRDGLACKLDSHCPGGACSRSNCEAPDDGRGCEDSACCERVCELDSYCCTDRWDEQCIDLAWSLCWDGAYNDECWTESNRLGATRMLVPDIAAVATEAASENPTDPGFCCHIDSPGATGVGTVWYRFVAPQPDEPDETHSSVLLGTCNSGDPVATDSLIQVFSVAEPDRGRCDNLALCSVTTQDCADGSTCRFDEAAACAALNPIACNDDAGESYVTSTAAPKPNNSKLCVPGLVPGDTYYVLVAAKSAETQGAYWLWVTPGCEGESHPANDLCEEATPLDGPDEQVPFDVSGVAGGTGPATFDCPGPSCDGAGSPLENDLWYAWTTPADGEVTIETCGADGASTPNTTMVVYRGCDCPVGPESELTCSYLTPSPCLLGSRAVLPVSSGACYLVRLGGHMGTTPSGTLSISLDTNRPDCNDNGVRDALDLAAGTSLDCNLNAVPDECDLDGGRSHDCNATGVPDECESIDGFDFDGNGQVDLTDFAAMLTAMRGPNRPPGSPAPECQWAYLSAFDADGDLDVDLADVAVMLRAGLVP